MPGPIYEAKFLKSKRFRITWKLSSRAEVEIIFTKIPKGYY